jgi:hypothetical protein
MTRLTMFSWGYWGWGNATPQIIKAVDAVERSRGFAPPIFADVRIRRSGRAKGFVGDAFEKLLGPGRYHHFVGLGNRNVAEGHASGITIDKPEEAAQLLALAQRAETENARVIYFCSCQFPHGPSTPTCHRTEVTDLLRKEATRAGIALTCVEWPGGEPEQHVTLQVSPAEMRAVRSGRKSLPIMGRVGFARAAGLAHGSTLELTSGEQRQTLGTGPAFFTGGQWCLPMHQFPDGTRQPAAWTAARRREHGFKPITNAAANSDAEALFPLSIYSIAQGTLLARSAETSGSGTLTEGRAWITGQRHLRAAQRENLELALLLGDATDCSRILYRATIQDITVEGDETRIKYSDLRALKGRHTPQDLVLASTGRNIAPDFIRPYAICRTPQWLRNS